jgi:hypothetical protein
MGVPCRTHLIQSSRCRAHDTLLLQGAIFLLARPRTFDTWPRLLLASQLSAQAMARLSSAKWHVSNSFGQNAETNKNGD